MDVSAIKEMLAERGWSQNEFARQCGFSPVSACKYLTGKQNPNLKNFKRMCEVLGVKAERIW